MTPFLILMYMYEVNLIKDGIDFYSATSRNEHNLILNFQIFNIVGSEFRLNKDYWVTFFITTKRKSGFLKLESTGKGGILSLIWAKLCLKKFMLEYYRKGDRIIVKGDDIKRFNAYRKGLESLGFISTLYGKDKVLIYKEM